MSRMNADRKKPRAIPPCPLRLARVLFVLLSIHLPSILPFAFIAVLCLARVLLVLSAFIRDIRPCPRASRSLRVHPRHPPSVRVPFFPSYSSPFSVPVRVAIFQVAHQAAKMGTSPETHRRLKSIGGRGNIDCIHPFKIRTERLTINATTATWSAEVFGPYGCDARFPVHRSFGSAGCARSTGRQRPAGRGDDRRGWNGQRAPATAA